MDKKTMKRKRYEVVKNDLGVELTKLTVDSGSLNNDILAANEDFAAICKSMTDRQMDFLTRSMLLEEKYGDVIRVLEDKGEDRNEDNSGENEVLPTGYAENIRKFVEDSGNSLRRHGEQMVKEYEEMDGAFKKFEEMWQDNMKELKVRAEQIADQRAKLLTKLFEFVRTTVEESDSE